MRAIADKVTFGDHSCPGRSDSQVSARSKQDPTKSYSWCGSPRPGSKHRSRVSSVHAIHPQMVRNKLKPLNDDVLSLMEAMGGSFSQLSMAVNDSAAGRTFQECYEQQDELGEGGFAVVYRCQHRERGLTYAVKEIYEAQYEECGECLKEEIDALKRLRDVPYIVRLLDIFQEPGKTYLVMEEMKGGDLLDRISEKVVYCEADARKVSRKLLEAIYFCHKKHIVHRDIKPENILLSSIENDTNIKLADFGCAKRFQPGTQKLFTLCGSPQYVAPELYTHNNEGYDERCDLWSAGIVIYLILGGYIPFDAEEYLLPQIIQKGEFEFHKKYWSDISEPPKKLIRSLITVNVERRATLEEALDDGWLRRRDKEALSLSYHTGNESLTSFEVWCQNQNSDLNGSIPGAYPHTPRGVSSLAFLISSGIGFPGGWMTTCWGIHQSKFGSSGSVPYFHVALGPSLGEEPSLLGKLEAGE
eukprot:Nitzschia sp. Nitz4//scaffold73_size107353//86454//90514//NITZ4_004330-RA/size107353-snap-gene-0.110-mRNA-1//-1//CDS//3329557506//8621//frame0